MMLELVHAASSIQRMHKEASVRRISNIEARIHLSRGQKVMLDFDLAELYSVRTMVFNQAVKRNRGRFPDHFMFRLTAREKQEVITNCDNLARLRFSPVAPFAFTEHGALMAATVLKSDRAIRMSIQVIEAFVRMRGIIDSQGALARHFRALERKVSDHDIEIQKILRVLRLLIAPPATAPGARREIGFHAILEETTKTRSKKQGRRVISANLSADIAKSRPL